jgi:hypothetical protein
MKKFCMSLVGLLVLTAMVLPAAAENAAEEVVVPAVEAAAQPVQELRPITLQDLFAAPEQVATASGNGRGPKPKGNSLTATGESGSNTAVACEWFWIECNNGTTDECCGSQSSCGAYCAEVCGGPCEYVPN